VYLHRGRQYLVEELDLDNRRCLVREAELNYFTDGLVKTDIKVLTEDEYFRYPDVPDALSPGEDGPRGEHAAPRTDGAVPQADGSIPLARAVLGDVLVRSQVSKFKKLRFRTHENIGYGSIDLAEEEMQTRALVFLFGPDTGGGAFLAGFDEESLAWILSGAGTLIKTIAPVFLLCDSRDLGVAERARDPHFGIPALYIYDKYPGGTGLSEALAQKAALLFKTILKTIESCPCEKGCPSCVGPGGNKAGTGAFLKILAG
jgi:DEAD/DEAH box helicase domain-containing protein